VSIRSLTMSRPEPILLNELLRKGLARWCQADPEVRLDMDNLSAEDPVIHADRQRMEMAVEILADNALRAMRSLPVKRLVVSSRVQGQRVIVDIQNTGEVPEGRRDLLFNRPVPKKPGEDGTGIGLLIVRYTMRHYGGGIELVRDGPEGMTQFTFWLPLYA
jgi:signal transduction histidine kinase